MAVGKSRVGRLLADRLNVSFRDTDAEIEACFGKAVAAIFSEHGEAEFRRAERLVIEDLVEQGPLVVSLGGGAFMDPRTRALLQASATTVWLDPPFEIISARLKRSISRPLAAGKSDEELFALWQERRPSYAEAHLQIQTSDEDPALAVDRIVAALACR